MAEKKLIMMVDDDKDHMLLCKLVLQKHGYDVITFSSCNEVIENIEVFMPDLIFIDHHMPGISGIQVTQMIKSHPSIRQIPVIYFSSCDDIINATKEAGADAFLEKPFQFGYMLALLKKFL